MTRPGMPEIDVRERGAPQDGNVQYLDRRLFMQLLAFHVREGQDLATVHAALCAGLTDRRIEAVVYEDINDPRGLGLLTWSEDPTHFVEAVRPALGGGALSSLVLRPELTMLGRAYSTGREADLQFWMVERPRKNALDAAYPWAVWYPLRRKGAFERLSQDDQRQVLLEHAILGRAYGDKDLAHDIRLACHGLDAQDNEFVIGLVGRTLHPLSHLVHAMRSTRQTSEFIDKMGPFFVGHVSFRSAA
jgi:chlorite dismutase